MNIKKTVMHILYPHIILRILLIPVSAFLLIYSMVVLGTDSPLAYISYALSAYTLTVWCLQIPAIVKFFVEFRNNNKYMKRWRSDPRPRVNVSLYGSCLFNTVYAAFLVLLAIYYKSIWHFSVAGYYTCLSVMRVFLLRHTRKNKPGKKMRVELSKYRICGWILLFLDLFLTAMVFLMVYQGKSFKHSEIVSIGLAFHSFTVLGFAIKNIIRYRKYNSPAFSAKCIISLTSACVSMLTLTSTMISSFGNGKNTPLYTSMLGMMGGAVSLLILSMAIYMIVRSSRRIKNCRASSLRKSNSKEKGIKQVVW